MARPGGVLVFLIALALAQSLAIGLARVGVERAARSVAIVVDGNDARALAAESGRTLEQVLRRFRLNGATGVAAYDETIPQLVRRGRVVVTPAQWAEGLEQSEGARPGITIVTDDASLGEAIAQRLAARFPAAALDFPHGDGGDGYRQIIFRGGLDELEAMGVCLARDIASAGREAGLDIVARTLNYPGVTEAAISYAIGDAAEQQAVAVIFDEKEVLGYPDLLPRLRNALHLGGLRYGSVEFAQQKGDAELGRLLGRGPPRQAMGLPPPPYYPPVVRVHSITEKELPNLTREEAAQRYLRAATDRNVRLCYLRALGGGWRDRLSANLRYVAQIARGLEERGFAVGRPSLFAPIDAPPWALGVIGMGVAAAGVLLVGLVLPMRGWHQWILLAVGVAGAAALALGAGAIGRKALALAAALVFPTLALVALARWLDSVPARRGGVGLVATCVAALLGVSAVSLVGGLLVGALLTNTLFLVKVDQFAGVKVAMLVPLAALALVLAGGTHARGERWSEYARRVGENFRRFLGQPVAVWQAALAALVLGAGLLLILRTGNEPGVGVSEAEMKFRALLENWLIARPRTKEFLLGHPALVLAVASALRGHRRLGALLLLAGGVGQVSLVNTFCHLHSPLLLSLLRTAHSLWIGAVLAGVVLVVWRLVARPRLGRT